MAWQMSQISVPWNTDLSERRAEPIVRTWTEVVRSLAPHVGAGRQPCDWGPWTRALDEAFVDVRPDALSPSEHLRFFAASTGAPGWPQNRGDLVDWALSYLEADVMLFRSGYTKRSLLVRLRQAALTEDDAARVEHLLRRAVMDGSGLEEFRTFCRLARSLHRAGKLSTLRNWLEERAEGAVLSWDRATGHMINDIHNARLHEADAARLNLRRGWRCRFGVVYPYLDQVVPTRRDTDARQRLNAYRMLRALQDS